MAAREKRPVCVHCEHFFVTWEPDQPRGCRAYEFKSSPYPSEVVLASSGSPCQLFERKRRKQSDERRRGTRPPTR